MPDTTVGLHILAGNADKHVTNAHIGWTALTTFMVGATVAWWIVTNHENFGFKRKSGWKHHWEMDIRNDREMDIQKPPSRSRYRQDVHSMRQIDYY
jgi:hypothetical protein